MGVMMRFVDRLKRRMGDERFDLLVSVVAAASIAFMLLLCCGCGLTRADPSEAQASQSQTTVNPGYDKSRCWRWRFMPDGTAIYERVDIDKKNDAVSESKSDASATSGGLTSTQKGALKGKIGAPTVDLPKGTAGGGTLEFSMKSMTSGLGILMISGVLCIVAGAVIGIWLGMRGLGVSLAGAGFAIIVGAYAFEAMPWLAPCLVIAAIGLAGFMIWKHFKDTKKRDATHRAMAVTAKTVVSAVSKAPKNLRERIMERVKDERGEHKRVVKDTVDSIRDQHNLRDVEDNSNV